MIATPKLDYLVQSVSLYTRKPILFHLYILPFILLYLIWLYLWLTVFGFTEYYEGGFLVLAAIGCLQVLCCLACYWSVHVNCFMTCNKVKKEYVERNILLLNDFLGKRSN